MMRWEPIIVALSIVATLAFIVWAGQHAPLH